MSYLRCSMFAAALLTASTSFAQSNAKETPAPDKQAQNDEEAQVLAKLHHANQMEIDAGKLAKENSESPKVKSYGEMLITDHRQADEMVRAFAERKGIQVKDPIAPTSAEKEAAKADKEMMDGLGDLKGVTFDSAFVTAMIGDHQKAIQLVRTARAESKDSEFRALLGKLLPVLEKHRARAESLQQQTKP